MSKTPRTFMLIVSGLCLSLQVSAAINVIVMKEPYFGEIYAGAPGRQFIIGSDDRLNGTHASDGIKGSLTGVLAVSDSTPGGTIRITASRITSLGFTSPVIYCDYDGGGWVQCDGAGMTATSIANATLYLGVAAQTSQAHSDGDSADVTFDITATYE
jgi:hypothetical protein